MTTLLLRSLLFLGPWSSVVKVQPSYGYLDASLRWHDRHLARMRFFLWAHPRSLPLLTYCFRGSIFAAVGVVVVLVLAVLPRVPGVVGKGRRGCACAKTPAMGCGAVRAWLFSFDLRGE